jgi:DNA-binding transcriptional LysR family regulator
MSKELKLTAPLDLEVEVLKAARETRRADQLAELAIQRAFAVFQVLKFPKKQELTPEGQKYLERVERAYDQLGEARHAMNDAAYQLEQLLK